MHDPSDAQREIIEQPVDTPALLVIAGPGSGKTRVLCDRIVHLIAQGVDPGQITAVTFTQLAAGELRKRVQERSTADVWTGTFHGYAYRILHEHGGRWRFPRPIRVLDEIGQRYALRNAFEAVTGWRCAEEDAREVARLISLRKRKGLEPDDMRYNQGGPAGFAEQLVRLVDEHYHAWLREQALFDYDELIYQVNLGLRRDEIALDAVRREARWLLVDEFQDVSDDQYAFISAVSPAGSGEGRFFAVADPRQSIYRFRGAGSDRLLARLMNEYRPICHHLRVNYRSTRSIVACANAIQSDPRRSALVSSNHHPAQAAHVYAFANETHEARVIARKVKERINAGDSPESIAVLYSTHRRADPVEEELRRLEIPLYRHTRNSIHSRPEAAPLLALMRDCADPARRPELLRVLGLEPACLVDELDWIRFDREPGAASPPPLGFDRRLAALEQCLARAAQSGTDRSTGDGATQLLNAYGPLVDAIGEQEWPILLDTLQYIDRYLTEIRGALRAAIDAGVAISVRVGTSLDARLAGILLREVLPEGDREAGELSLCLDCNAPPGAFAIHLREIADRTMVVSLTTQVWRLAQLLLTPERLDCGSFVAIDLETTSKWPNRAEIIEIGAIRFDAATGEELDRFDSLVRTHQLAGDISRLTGIRLPELAQAPPAIDVLQRFIDWLKPEDVLVGHNVAEFDLAVLNRLAAEHGFPPLVQASIDTLTWCGRFLPAMSHQLEDLIGALGLTPRVSHRAIPDAQTTAELMRLLLAERDARLRIRALDGALPLVAASLLSRSQSAGGDNQLLVELGARRLRIGAAGRFAERADAELGSEWRLKQFQLGELKLAMTREEESWNEFAREWTELIDHHTSLMPDLTPAELAGSIAISSPAGSGDQTGRVTMMTIHAAKGKEWPTVIVIGAEDDQFPAMGNPEPEDLAEGARLFYVGVTRAMSRLLISFAWRRSDKDRAPSRHLAQLPRDEATVIRRGQHRPLVR